MDKFILGILVLFIGIFVLPFVGSVLGRLIVSGLLVALAVYLIVEMVKTIRRT